MPGQSGAGQGAWVVLTGPVAAHAGLAAVAVDTEALIWILVWMGFLTIRGGHSPKGQVAHHG